MDEKVKQLLERQAAWQRSLRDLSWAEKLRMAEAWRGVLLVFRNMRASEDKDSQKPSG